MSQTIEASRTGATIFDAWSGNPSNVIARDIVRANGAERKYRQSKNMLDATALLDSIENLRRFVLVRATLAKVLARPSRRSGGAPIGKQLGETLHAIIGDVPSLVESCTAQGHCRMERDMRRAIACLIFLGSLDPDFI